MIELTSQNALEMHGLSSEILILALFFLSSTTSGLNFLAGDFFLTGLLSSVVTLFDLGIDDACETEIYLQLFNTTTFAFPNFLTEVRLTVNTNYCQA